MAGYFGKLPAKADFVIGQCPRGFLNVWEPFLLQGLSQSRLDLKDSWKEAYMTMPVWRFELNLQTAGDSADRYEQKMVGAFMPSIDRVGREYPLSVAAELEADEGTPLDTWYEEVETVLLSALQDDNRFEIFQSAVTGLPAPVGEAEDLAGVGQELPAGSDGNTVVSSSFGCRAGDQDILFSCKGLPDAGAFQWLILPERLIAQDQEMAGDTHGRYHPEDHRT